MKANELRIGNYLDYYGQTVIVLELLKNDDAEFGYFTDSIGFNRKLTEDHSPKSIPLTEEWLIDFGFELKEEHFQDNLLDTFMFHKDNIVDVEFSDKHKLLFWHDDYTGVYHQEIKHVHQLQNLYYALIGEELSIY